MSARLTSPYAESRTRRNGITNSTIGFWHFQYLLILIVAVVNRRFFRSLHMDGSLSLDGAKSSSVNNSSSSRNASFSRQWSALQRSDRTRFVLMVGASTHALLNLYYDNVSDGRLPPALVPIMLFQVTSFFIFFPLSYSHCYICIQTKIGPPTKCEC